MTMRRNVRGGPLFPQRPIETPKEDKRMERVLMATNCLGCGCEEGGYHETGCPFRQDTQGEYAFDTIKSLSIDLRALIRSYGLEPRYATLDALGNLTIMGPRRK